MVTSEQVKQLAKNCGADLCGIASMDRFEGAPVQFDPRYIFPGAKSMIVLGYRIPRGSLRGIEEGTFFINYSSMGYAGINLIYGPMVLWNLNRFLEDEGYETVPIPNMNGGEAVSPLTGNFRKGWSMSVDGQKPHPDVLIHYRIAAFCAGLGEIGYSRLVLTPEFGPRVRFNILLTAAPLEPDPIYNGPKLCDRCMQCVRNCTTGAISKTETVKVRVAGHDLEWGKLDPMACEAGVKGGYQGERNPFLDDYPHQFGYGRAIEGAAGCIRACMVHLEKQDKLTKKFSEPFRTNRMWAVDHKNKDQVAPLVEEQYIQKGKVEDFTDFINYNKTSNYGTEKNPSSDTGAGLGKDDE
jgi:ferredoxin